MKEIIISLVSAVIGGGFSIYIYKKGIKDKDKEARIKRITNNFEIEEYFINNIRAILEFIDYQVDEISKTSKRTKDWSQKNLTLPIFEELKLNDLSQLNFKVLFQIFVIDREGLKKEKVKDFINLRNSLNNIEKLILTQESRNRDQSIELNKVLDNWNFNIKHLVLLYNNFALENPPIDDEFMQILHKYIVEKQRVLIQKNKEQNIKLLYNEIIYPLENEIVKLKKDKRILPVIDNIMECRKSYIQTKTLRIQTRTNLIHSGRTLLKIKQLLKESLTSIEARKKRLS